MRVITALVLFAVELGGVFGQASAEVVAMGDQSMTVEISVEVDGTFDAVVAHLALPNEPDLALPLLDRGDGTFGITTEVKAADYSVVFETLGEVSSQSQPVSITDLGVDLGEAGGSPGTTDDGLSSDTAGWGWLALAFGAASLAALAFWVLGARDDDQGPADDGTEPVPDSDEDELGGPPVEAAQPGEGSAPAP